MIVSVVEIAGLSVLISLNRTLMTVSARLSKMYRVGGNIAEGEAPQKIEGVVKEAADSCPVQIIHVTWNRSNTVSGASWELIFVF